MFHHYFLYKYVRTTNRLEIMYNFIIKSENRKWRQNIFFSKLTNPHDIASFPDTTESGINFRRNNNGINDELQFIFGENNFMHCMSLRMVIQTIQWRRD